MRDLLVAVVSWNRPQLLRRTLDSLFEQLGSLDSAVWVVDNGSELPTAELIQQEWRLEGYRLLGTNLGINGALESLLTKDLTDRFRCLLVSDADMEYRQSLQRAVALLACRDEIGAVSYQHSPEHPVLGELTIQGAAWFLKSSERGCALVLRTDDYQRVRPLPVDNLKDFDWWVARDAPQSLRNRGLSIAVLPGGARHLGWRQGDSTWQVTEIPEFLEFQT